jgi:Tfp pilus assembly protein PilF
MGRWTSVAPGQNSFGIDLPGGSGAKEYSVRFSVADAAGNKAFAVVGPHELRSPITLGSFTATKSYLEGAGEKIRWQLHPAMSEAGDSLRVSVAHLPRKDGEWVQIYGDLQPSSECYWELPAAGGEEHRLRVRLLKGGKVIGEDISPPFSVAARDLTAPTVVKVSEESLFTSNQARAKAETYYAAVAAGESASSSAELEKLAAEISGGFQKALEIDKNNHAATYGMAQFLNRADSVRNAQEVQRWLLRTIEIKPDHAWALNDLGALHIRAGDFKAAEEALRRSAAIKPSPIILYNLGIALFYGGSVREAREKLESALKEDTMQSLPRGEICCYLIQAHIQEGNLQEARALFKENESAIPPDLREGLVKSIGE